MLGLMLSTTRNRRTRGCSSEAEHQLFNGHLREIENRFHVSLPLTQAPPCTSKWARPLGVQDAGSIPVTRSDEVTYGDRQVQPAQSMQLR